MHNVTNLTTYPLNNTQKSGNNPVKRKLDCNPKSLGNKIPTNANSASSTQRSVKPRFSTPQPEKQNTFFGTYTDPEKSKSSRKKGDMTDKELFNRELSAFGPFDKKNLIEKGSEGSVYKGTSVIKVPHSTQHKKELNTQILEYLRKHPRLFAAPITNGFFEIQQDAGPDFFTIVNAILCASPSIDTNDTQIKELLHTKSYDALLLHYLTPTSEGLAQLHQNNIIHGDIKLENLAKKIIDFGQTQYIHEDTFLKGTPQYMHPVLHQETFPLKYQEKQLKNCLYQKLKYLSVSNETYLTLINIPLENPDSYFISKILESKSYLLTKVNHEYERLKKMLNKTSIGDRNIFPICEDIKVYSNLYTKLCQFTKSHNAAYLSPHEKHILSNLLKNETLAYKFTTLNVETLKNLRTKTSSKTSKFNEDIKERLSSQEIESLTHKKELYLIELQYIESILETIDEYKQHEAYYRTHSNSFVTNQGHKKSYDIYAFSLSIIIACLSALKSTYAANLASNIVLGDISKETIPQEIKKLMQVQFGSYTNPASKLINFILENDYLSSDIKAHTDSARKIHEFILSLNQINKVSDGDTSSESSVTTSESSRKHKSRAHAKHLLV